MGPVLDSIRADVDEQFKISERLDSKARNLIAIVGAFFTVVQTLSKDAFLSAAATTDERLTIGGLGIVAAFMIVAAIIMTAKAWQLVKEGLMPAKHFQRIVDETYEGSTRGPRDLAALYIQVLAVRRASNATRADRLRTASGLCLAATLVALVQFVVAMIVQAP